jgi:hypothetical protein
MSKQVTLMLRVIRLAVIRTRRTALHCTADPFSVTLGLDPLN